MKTIYALLLSLIATATAFAGNETYSFEPVEVSTEIANLNCEDCLLDFGKESKVVITDKNGHVIFYGESVELLDISNWNKGAYVAKINDSETFEFTL